jgi:hypothetical protein
MTIMDDIPENVFSFGENHLPPTNPSNCTTET